MEKKWILKTAPNTQNVLELSQQLNINPILAGILVQRGVLDFEQAKSFFRPGLEDLHDPFLMKDMDLAVNRLCDAISEKEKILIYGDYDVDGTTAVALVYQVLKHFSDLIIYYVPDRYKEGYGISKTGIDWASAQEVNLIIALDCGIKALENAQYANELNIDLIICDHHLPGEKLPDALAVLDPKREDCPYPYKELSGCGIGFKFMSAFMMQNTMDMNVLYDYLDLVAVSIASDIVPLTGENRVLAFYGLKKINQSPTAGIQSLIEIAGIKPPIDISDIVFYIGPRINASGRLTHAKESVEVLIASSPDTLKDIAKELNEKNVLRREYDHNITQEALELIEEDEQKKNAKSTVLFKEDWHKGVIGIVASRCTEYYYRPTIILTQSNGKATGSARSVPGYNIYQAIDQCKEHLDQFGGHHFAAGLTLGMDKIDVFAEAFEKAVSDTISEDLLIPKLDVDQIVDLEFVNFKSYSILSQMSPFGPFNQKPIFVSRNVILKRPPRVIKEEHLKLSVGQDGNSKSYEAIGFGLAKWADELTKVSSFQIAYQIDENFYRGHKSLQLNLKDIKFSD